MIFRWRLTPLFVLAALLNPSDQPPDANHAREMEDDRTPMELVNLWLDPIPPVLIINTPKLYSTLVTPRARIDASRILSVCVGEPPDFNTSNMDTNTSSCDPTLPVYNLPVGIHETSDTQPPVLNKRTVRLKFRHQLNAIMDGNLLLWLDILYWLLRPLVTLFREKTRSTLASGVQIPQASRHQSAKGRALRKSKKRALRSRSKRSVVVKDDLCDLLGVLILGSQQVLEVNNLGQGQEFKGIAENDKADRVVAPPALDLSPGHVSEVLKTANTCVNDMDIVVGPSEKVISVQHRATTSNASSIYMSNDVEVSPYCRKGDALEKDMDDVMTFEEQMRRDVPFLCTDDSGSESGDEEMGMTAAIRDWIESQTSIKSSVKQIKSGMAHLSESGLSQHSSVLPQSLHCDISLALAHQISSAEALLGPCVALGAKADNTSVVEEHGLEPAQQVDTSEPLLDITGMQHEDAAPLETDKSLDARGILAGYPKGWWNASLLQETELQTLESDDLDFGFESFDVSELVAHLPETCYPRLMDVSIGAIERAEIVGDSTEVGITEIETEGHALETSTAVMSSLPEVESTEASSIHPVDSDALVGALNTSTQSISLVEEGSLQNEESQKQNIEEYSTTHDEDQQNEDPASLVAEKSMDIQDILARGSWNSSLLDVSELENLQESGDLDFGFESFDISELVAHLPETCYPRLMDVSIGAIERAEVVGDLTEGGTTEIESEGAALETSSTAIIVTHEVIDTTKESESGFNPPNADEENVLGSLEVDISLDVCELMAWYPAHCWNQPLLEELAVQPSSGTSPGHLEISGDLGSGVDGFNLAELIGQWPKGWRDPRLMDVSVRVISRVAVEDPVKGVVEVSRSLGQSVVDGMENEESTVKPVPDRCVASKPRKSKSRKPLTSITNKLEVSRDVARKSRSSSNPEVGKLEAPETTLINNKTIITPDEHKILLSGQVSCVESANFIDPALALERLELSETTVGPSATKSTSTIMEQVTLSCRDKDVRPIYIRSSKELKDAFDRMKPFFVGKETEDNWLKRQKSVDEIRGMLLTKVHITLKSDFHKNLKGGVLKCTLLALASLRTTLSSKAASLYSELAIAMGPSFNGSLISIVFPSLLRMSGFTNAIIADKTQQTVADILENGSYQSVYMVSQLVGTYDGERNAKVRTHMMKHVQTVLKVHCPQAKGTPGINQSMRVLEGCLLIGLSDPSKEVKEISRSCFLVYEGLWPKAGFAMRAKMDAKVKKLLEGVTSRVDGEMDSIAKQATRATSARQSVSKQKNVTGTRSAMHER